MNTPPDLSALLPNSAERAARREQLTREVREPPRKRRSAGVRVAALAMLMAAIVAVVTLGDGHVSAPQLNVVAQAQAAIATPGELLHVKIRYDPGAYGSFAAVVDGPRGRMIGRFNGVSERWSTNNPVREREVTFLVDADGRPAATMQTDYARGVTHRRNSWQRRTTTERLRPAARARYERDPRLTSLAQGALTRDPIAGIRALLAAGKLRAEGIQNVNGHVADRLVGSAPSGTHADGGTTPVHYEYFVDASTHAPIRIRAVELIPARPTDPEPAARKDRHLLTIWTFETFERLALNKANEALLHIKTK